MFACPEGQRLRYRGLNRQTQVYVYYSTPAQSRGMGIGITPSSSIAEREGHERVPGDVATYCLPTTLWVIGPLTICPPRLAFQRRCPSGGPAPGSSPRARR